MVPRRFFRNAPPAVEWNRFRLTPARERMSRHYSTKVFLRQMPNALLARYFQARRLFGDPDFSAMKETQPDELFAAWLDLPDGQRNEVDAETGSRACPSARAIASRSAGPMPPSCLASAHDGRCLR